MANKRLNHKTRKQHIAKIPKQNLQNTSEHSAQSDPKSDPQEGKRNTSTYLQAGAQNCSKVTHVLQNGTQNDAKSDPGGVQGAGRPIMPFMLHPLVPKWSILGSIWESIFPYIRQKCEKKVHTKQHQKQNTLFPLFGSFLRPLDPWKLSSRLHGSVVFKNRPGRPQDTKNAPKCLQNCA